MAFEEDFGVFFSADDFAVSALYTPYGYPHPCSESITVYGIFENKYIETEGIQGRKPTFNCAESIIDNITEGDQLEINSVVYTVKDWDIDGTGEILLLLRKNDS